MHIVASKVTAERTETVDEISTLQMGKVKHFLKSNPKQGKKREKKNHKTSKKIEA